MELNAFAVMMRASKGGENHTKRPRSASQEQLHSVMGARAELTAMGFGYETANRALQMHAHGGGLVNLSHAVASCIKITGNCAAGDLSSSPAASTRAIGGKEDEEGQKPRDGETNRIRKRPNSPDAAWWSQTEQRRFRLCTPRSHAWWEGPSQGQQDEREQKAHKLVFDVAKDQLEEECSAGVSRWLEPHVVSDVPGLFQFHDFISEEEEARLVEALEEEGKYHWKRSLFNGECMSQGWGVRTDLLRRTVRPNIACKGERDMPAFLLQVVERFQRRCRILRDFSPNEANANRYERARGNLLTPHFDDRRLSGEMLVNLSLCSSCVMTFEKQGFPPVPVTLPRRSLQVSMCA
jgi:hypothetical protein